MFTSTEPMPQFKKDAIGKMRKAVGLDAKDINQGKNGDWCTLKEIARKTVDEVLSQPLSRILLVDLARIVTLKVSLHYLSDAPDGTLKPHKEREYLALLGRKINELWMKSKGHPENLPRWESPENHELHQALRAVCQSKVAKFQPEPLDPTLNPMNWLLPAYETMWRAVFVCVIELRFRHGHVPGRPGAPISTLLGWLNNPAREPFHDSMNYCAMDIIKETLRLYPPTRRVYRRVPEEGKTMTESGTDVKADIEACHHNTTANGFGPNALEWQPDRWWMMRHEIGWGYTSYKEMQEGEEERGFFPFAHNCPAGKQETQEFGYKMIALLAGAICEGLEKRPLWDLENKEAYADRSMPLPSERDAFEHVFLIKKP